MSSFYKCKKCGSYHTSEDCQVKEDSWDMDWLQEEMEKVSE